VYGLQRGHQNGDFAGTGGRDNHVAMTVRGLTGVQGVQVPASVKRQFVAKFVEVGNQYV
jgi:hypothetical protein